MIRFEVEREQNVRYARFYLLCGFVGLFVLFSTFLVRSKLQLSRRLSSSSSSSSFREVL